MFILQRIKDGRVLGYSEFSTLRGLITAAYQTLEAAAKFPINRKFTFDEDGIATRNYEGFTGPETLLLTIR